MKKNLLLLLIPVFAFAGALRFFSVLPSAGVLPIDPSTVSGLTIWYDAADGANSYTDTGCSSLVASDGDSVKCWKDKAGTAYNSTEATNAPLHKTNIKNGKSVLRFDGTNDKLTGPSNFRLQYDVSSFTFIAVVNPKSMNSSGANSYQNSQIFCDKDGGITELYTKSPNIIGWQAWVPPASPNSVGLSQNHAADAWYIISIRRDAGTGKHYLRINGTETDTTGGAINTGYVGPLYLGTNYNAGLFQEMDIGDFLVYNTTVSSTNLDGIDAFFKQKWAISY